MPFLIFFNCFLVLVSSANVTCPACKVVEGNFALTVVCESLCGIVSPPEAQRRKGGFKIIGAGLGRTGTASLQAAFGILGFKSYHMSEVIINLGRGDVEKWAAATQNCSIQEIVPMLLENGYDASCDEPVNHFTLQLIEAFPDAKVVLTTRADANKWVRSVQQISYALSTLDLIPFGWVFGRFNAFARDFHGARGYKLTADLDHFDNGAAIKYYNEWNAKIRSRVPPERLLDFQVQQGWEPLCRFLGVPVPEVPFPKVNDKVGMAIAIKVITGLHYLFLTSPIFLFLCMRYCCFRRPSSSAKMKLT
eukprot:gnl/MRDRNA2_/MRDRNA2_250299_c0_seq1.p1 gnl/MRDRNA2_/MRDRNA2_250299_c0~~gnl/MRDRNA2_/MRDRNA2_250299_c0_seq1.p1  ORF type:complete len:306 (-),score=31.33 gnl/MRDRNA2_/MRDRNA2_250299_c0_seq1:209-1126(-)